jgi:hypothetical protein
MPSNVGGPLTRRSAGIALAYTLPAAFALWTPAASASVLPHSRETSARPGMWGLRLLLLVSCAMLVVSTVSWAMS